MTEAERYHFDILKQRIAEVQAGERPLKPVEEWGARDIEEFREDLQEQVQGSISEKWFYTHMKSREREKLPRIDTLDLLSRYVGYDGWEALKAAHPYGVEEAEGKRKRRKYWIGGLAGILLIALGSIPFFKSERNDYRLCFVNADTGERIRDQRIHLQLLQKEGSPISLRCDTAGCVDLPLRGDGFRLIVNAPYYEKDTIVRKAGLAERKEQIPLQADDRILMIGHYSASAPKDRKKRRERLDRILADDARIYQVLGEEQRGVAMYNKEEFIEKLTMPLQSLERIEVLETRYNDAGKVRSIRFRQAPKQKEGS